MAWGIGANVLAWAWLHGPEAVCCRIATATVCQPGVFRFHRNNSSNARIARGAA